MKWNNNSSYNARTTGGVVSITAITSSNPDNTRLMPGISITHVYDSDKQRSGGSINFFFTDELDREAFIGIVRNCYDIR